MASPSRDPKFISQYPDALSPGTLFDAQLVARHRDRIALTYPHHCFLKDRVVSDLANRLQRVRRTFKQGIDLGCHTGQMAKAVEEILSIKLLCADISEKMVASCPITHKLVIDLETFPFADHAFDLVLSALSLHWVNDIPGLFAQIYKALKPDGLFMASLLGEETLKELRECLQIAELELNGGVSPRVSPMLTLQDAGGLLQRAGFALPVVDQDRLQITYPHPLALLQDLRNMGETNALYQRSHTVTSRSLFTRAFELYQEKYSLPDGRITATFEIITLTGWAPHDSQPTPLRRGSATSYLGNHV
ncbi:MAG: methyltransferase domain-containing protein [Alphaproteobacteria bacterium]|nr:methyltransferase domain-containing protein [Alphaproteobacteria bacterium]